MIAKHRPAPASLTPEQIREQYLRTQHAEPSMPNIRFTAPAPTHQQQQQQQQSDEEDASFSSSKDGLLTKLYQENQDMKAKIAELESMIGQAKPFDARHVKAIVQPFSGDDLMDIHTWLAKLEDTFRVLKVGKTEQLVAACELLTGTAEVFRRITTLKDYDDFRTKLVEEFHYSKLTDETIVKELRKHTLKDNNVHRSSSSKAIISQATTVYVAYVRTERATACEKVCVRAPMPRCWWCKSTTNYAPAPEIRLFVKGAQCNISHKTTSHRWFIGQAI
uniref:Uncharacterized protein n=1 Tax=Anopheles merus TaxID=30066 RepID=A0A182VL81_ANOME